MKKRWTFLLVLLLVFAVACQATPAPAETQEETKAETEKPETKEAKEETKTEAHADKVELIVSAAASLTDVMDELKAVYEKDHNVTLKISYAGSGTLQTQIEEGAPVDVFVSAAQKQMNALEEKDLILKDSRVDLLENKVVLISNAARENTLKSFEELAKLEGKLAIGDPTNVPVGQYSQEILEKLNLWEGLKEKLVYGTDVRTVLTWIENDEMDYGIVYSTDAKTTEKVKILAEAPEGTHKPVIYPVAIVKSSKQVEAAKAFIEFLRSEASQKAFESYGFAIPK